MACLLTLVYCAGHRSAALPHRQCPQHTSGRQQLASQLRPAARHELAPHRQHHQLVCHAGEFEHPPEDIFPQIEGKVKIGINGEPLNSSSTACTWYAWLELTPLCAAGFGRIGRLVARAALLRKNFEIVAINDPFIDAECEHPQIFLRGDPFLALKADNRMLLCRHVVHDEGGG